MRPDCDSEQQVQLCTGKWLRIRQVQLCTGKWLRIRQVQLCTGKWPRIRQGFKRIRVRLVLLIFISSILCEKITDIMHCLQKPKHRNFFQHNNKFKVTKERNSTICRRRCLNAEKQLCIITMYNDKDITTPKEIILMFYR